MKMKLNLGEGTVGKNKGSWGKKSGKVGRKHHSLKSKSGGQKQGGQSDRVPKAS